MRTIQDSETRAILQKIRSPKKLKKYYLAMEFNKINNPEFEDERLYSLDLLAQNNRAPLYTPQINNISMEMPSSPILYNWHKVPKVAFSSIYITNSYHNTVVIIYLRIKYVIIWIEKHRVLMIPTFVHVFIRLSLILAMLLRW